MRTDQIHPEVEQSERLIAVAKELSTYFPDLDLRFNVQEGGNTLRCLIPEHSDRVIEIGAERSSFDDLLNEAVFSIKEIARLFDA